jgi:CRP-like cAMP-binding protein
LPQGTRLESLRAAHELASYPVHQLQALLSYFDEVTLPAGTLIAREGESCTAFVVVIGGRLTASAQGAGSHALVAGDTIGLEAMWKREPNSATVVVDSEARLLVMSHAQFRALKGIAIPSM